MFYFHQVLCDRHFGGINYPVGGVGGIAKSLAKGLIDQGSEIMYKANVTSIIVENGKAVSNYLPTLWSPFGEIKLMIFLKTYICKL